MKTKINLRLILGMLPAFIVLILAPTSVANARPLAGSPNYLTALLDGPAIVRIISAAEGTRVVCHRCLSDGSDLVVSPSPAEGAYSYGLAGSGAFVSPDGYILTADHVLDQTMLRDGVLASTSNDVVQSFDAQLHLKDIASHYKISEPVAAYLVLLYYQQQQQVEIDGYQTASWALLSTAYTGTIQNSTQVVAYPIMRVVASSPPDKQDVAIIQIQAQDMPNLALAPDSAVRLKESVTAIAFPAAADNASVSDPKDAAKKGLDFPCLLNPSSCPVDRMNNLLTATQSQGQIICKGQLTATGQCKQIPAGLLYNTSPTGNHGSSGGPVIDQQGRIVGIVETGPPSGDYTTLLSGQAISTYIAQAGITNAGQGTFEAAWTKALTEYESAAPCHFAGVARDLEALHENYPQFGAVLPMLHDAQSRVTSGGCTPSSSGLLSALLVGGLILIVLALLGIIVVPGRKKDQAAPGVAGAGSASGMAGTAPKRPAAPANAWSSTEGNAPLEGSQPGQPGPFQAPIRDTHIYLPISPQEASWGAYRPVTFAGQRIVQVPIPRGSYPGQVIRLEGLGEAVYPNGSRAALVITFTIPTGQTFSAPLAPPARAQAARPTRGVSWALISVALILLLVVSGFGSYVALRFLAGSSNPAPVAAGSLSASPTPGANHSATATVIANPYPAYLAGHGTIALIDSLQNNNGGHGWEDGSDNRGSCSFQQEAYHIKSITSRYYRGCAPALFPGFHNFALEIHMSIIQGDCGAVAFRANPSSVQGYAFQVCRNGEFGLDLFQDASHISPLRDQMSSAIQQQGENVLAVVANASRIILYINHQPVATITDQTYAQGQVILAALEINNPTEVAFTDLRIWI